MPVDARNLFAVTALVSLLVAIVWATMGSGLPPADFTFCNGTEVKSFDPAIVSGNPEGNILNALFERLTRWDPETLEPIPGVAESWEISDDLLTYTFHLRDDALWSDGSSVTADDFHYSWRRFLGPRTAAEYAVLAWTIKNARRYSQGGSGISPGDPVEVELNLPVDSLNTLRGELVQGKLVSVENADDPENRTFLVEIDGRQQRFDPVDDQGAVGSPPSGARWCRQVLLDFREVGIQVLDSQTLRVTLENPTPYFLKLVGFYPFSPVNQNCIETHGTPHWTKPGNIVSNGPFNVQFRRIRDRIRMVKSETYWNRDAVRLNVVDALAVDSNSTALNLFMTGKADWIITVPPAALRIMLEQDPPRDDLNPAPFIGTYYYMLNTTRKPLDDVRVRKALSLALDREEICTKIMAAGEIPAYGLVPPGMEGYEGQTCAAEDPEEARRLLAEAGYPEGKGFPRMDILYNTDEAHQTVAELIRKQWQRELGIQIKTRNEEWASYLSSQRQMKYNVCRRGWIGDYADPSTFLDMFVTGGEQNNTGWSNPRYDALIEQAAREVDPEKRMQIFRQTERILMDELPILPIYFYVSKNMVKPYVRGFYNNIQDVHPVWAMWIDRDHEGPNEFMKGRP
ncbi:MAG: peptide ABC transporter substrate-binding protein [Planctomycetes bacterium]|nr:peptide ABC transporter substrate-binding protein [Planctomycetota bacterium]